MKKRVGGAFLSLLFVLFLFIGYTSGLMLEKDQYAVRDSIAATFDANGAIPLSAENTVVFNDVPADAWYADAVAFCRQNGLMTGTSATAFSPDMDLSRAMIVTILYRAAGSPVATESAPFSETASGEWYSDTPSGEWYSDAVVWASQNSIVSGYGNDLFGTNDPITREQLITILWRYDGSPAVTYAPAFTDVNAISPWATIAVIWGGEQGIINSRDENRLEPKENATRAEAAYMLMQYLSPLYIASSETPLTSENPDVYFTADISPKGLVAVYKALDASPAGKVAVKITTGEPPNSNYLRPELIKDLVQSVNATIVESNTAYGGRRASSAMHLQVAKDHGFTDIAEFDLMDIDGSISLPVSGGEILTENFVGSHFANYDYFIVLSHFKGHQMAGYGGAIKNTSIGIASSSGKAWIHTGGRSKSGIGGGNQDNFLKSMAEAGKSVSDSLHGNILYINVMNRLSVDCDCNGNPSEPDMHDIGILSSYDPVALDQACIDLVYAAEDSASLKRRIESRNGVLAVEHGEAIGLGSREYNLVNID